MFWLIAQAGRLTSVMQSTRDTERRSLIELEIIHQKELFLVEDDTAADIWRFVECYTSYFCVWWSICAYVHLRREKVIFLSPARRLRLSPLSRIFKARILWKSKKKVQKKKVIHVIDRIVFQKDWTDVLNKPHIILGRHKSERDQTTTGKKITITRWEAPAKIIFDHGHDKRSPSNERYVVFLLTSHGAGRTQILFWASSLRGWFSNSGFNNFDYHYR